MFGTYVISFVKSLFGEICERRASILLGGRVEWSIQKTTYAAHGSDSIGLFID